MEQKHISKHIKLCYLDNNLNIRWNHWDFKDLILSKPIKITENHSITYNIKEIGEDYVLYFLLQYPNGHLKWFGITNNQTKTIYIDNSSKANENTIYISKKSVKISHRELLENMKLVKSNKSEILPAQIVALRIRSDIFNNEICIEDINLN